MSSAGGALHVSHVKIANHQFKTYGEKWVFGLRLNELTVSASRTAAEIAYCSTRLAPATECEHSMQIYMIFTRQNGSSLQDIQERKQQAKLQITS